MTPELAAAWAAAIALATERRHAEVLEDHVLMALLFDEAIEEHVRETGDLARLTKILDDRLFPSESYRAGATLPRIRPSLERTLASAGRGPLGLRAAFGLPISTRMLFDALVSRADTEIQSALSLAPPASVRDPFEVSVFLDRDPVIGTDRLIEWTMLFGVSRARATFVVYTAHAKGSALVAHLPAAEARPAHAMVVEAAEASGVITPFTVVEGRGIVGVARSIGDVAMDTRAVIGQAHDIALARGDAVITVAHVAIALLDHDAIEHMLTSLAVDGASLRASFADMLARSTYGEDAVTHAPFLGDDVEVMLETARIYATDRVRLPQLFASLFTHRESRVLLEAHRVKKRDVLLAFLGNIEGDRDITDEETVDVVFLNDDYTTQEMVVAILAHAFDFGPAEAKQWMLKVHFEGEAAIGTYEAREARRRIAHGLGMAREADMPLRIALRKRRC
jgi:ATP-dependent Clp protease adapter protein ClpS